MLKIGIIGGSGLDDPDFFKNPDILDMDTDYGKPSSLLLSGTIDEVETIILSRHGTKHQYCPTQVNNRANIKALQKAGVTHIIATTACGSLKEEIERGHLIILDQFIDFTRFRKGTFVESFENGIIHPAMPHPFDDNLRSILYKTAKYLNLNVHERLLKQCLPMKQVFPMLLLQCQQIMTPGKRMKNLLPGMRFLKYLIKMLIM